MVVSRDGGGKTHTDRYIPRVHGDPPPVSMDYKMASELIDPADERRSFNATALKRHHTNLHIATPPPPTSDQRRATLALGGFFTKQGDEYRKESAVKPQECQPDTDDAPEIPWE